MCVQNTRKVILLIFLSVCLGAFFLGCEAIETMLPSAGNYKINVQINNIPLDECSFVTSIDNIQPIFEESVSNDQDVTGLTVFIKNSNQDIVGQKVTYSFNNDGLKADDEILITVKNLDHLPSFPIPVDLPVGMYTIVSQVMSGGSILQKTERHFYYLKEIDFTFEGINVYLPGITDNSQLIPRGAMVMLEAGVVFSDALDPYIIWYEGRKKVSEGYFSDGAGCLFWKAPEQSGFFSLRAEVLPVNYSKLAGYNNEISLLVSSSFKTSDMHLVSGNNPQLKLWYTFEGNVNNLTSTVLTEPAHSGNSRKWMGVNGTYGLVTGFNNALTLANIAVHESESKSWQTLFRFMPLHDGEIFSVSFNPARNVYLRLSAEGGDFVLTLTSPLKTVTRVLSIPEENKSSFISASAGFSYKQGVLSAQINNTGDFAWINSAMITLALDADIEREFTVLLGSLPDNKIKSDNPETRAGAEYAVLWDEFALYSMPVPEKTLSELSAEKQISMGGF